MHSNEKVDVLTTQRKQNKQAKAAKHVHGYFTTQLPKKTETPMYLKPKELNLKEWLQLGV